MSTARPTFRAHFNRALTTTLTALTAVTMITLAAPTAPVTTSPGLPITLVSGPAPGSPVDDFPLYQEQVSCDPVAKPGVTATRTLLRSKFGGGDLGITRACSVGGISEHKEGRAWDWALNANKASDRLIASKAIKWLTQSVNGEPAAHARQLGIAYMIFDRRIIGMYNLDRGWQPYTGPNPHTDHIHISFTWNGAMKNTSWWKGRPQALDFGPCVRWNGELAQPWKAPRLLPCPPSLNRPKANAWGIYRAQEGETIYRVTRWFHRTDAQIRAWNDFPRTGPVRLHPGQKIRVVRPLLK